MEQHRIDAYRFIESKVLLDIKQIAAKFLLPKSVFVFVFRKNRRTVECLARLSYAIHNLPIFLENRNMNNFDEKLFWQDMDELTNNFNDILFTNYRALFEKYLNGEEVNILEH